MYQQSGVEVAKGSPRETLIVMFSKAAFLAKQKISDFQEKLSGDAEQAMKWSDEVFVATAKMAIANQVVHCLKHYTNMEEVTEVLMQGILDKSRWAHNKGTNVVGDYLNECLLAETTQAYEMVKRVNR